MTQNITKVTVTDFMGIGGTVELFPEGSLQLIAGPNGSGKSSLIHALEEIFDPKGTRLIPKPIHDGATEARVEVETTTARLVRVWPKDGPGTLSAYALDGAKYPSGKDFVVEATGGVLFDPDEFVQLDEKKQRDQLLARVELPFDLDEITAKRKGFFDARTDKTREVKRLGAQLAGYAPADASLPQEEVSASALVAELDKIREHNAEADRRVDAYNAAVDARDAAEVRGRELAAALEQARADHKALVVAKQAATDALDAIERKSPDAVTEQLANIDDVNAKVRAQAARAAVAAELADRTGEEATLTASIAAIDQTKADGLAAAVFPAGLGVDDTGIVFGGIPFKQVNSAQQDIIAFDLATSARPDLRLVVMKSGDRLDEVRLEAIRKLADERGYLVFMERDRDESRELGFCVGEKVVSA